ncbi:MAG: integrase arm-type DNA-binding domain-containing protein [Pseudomonas sp.]
MPKLIKPLTPSEVANAKPGRKPYTLRDGNGLEVMVMPNGSKLWRLRYRRPVTSRRNTLGMGAYPAVTLAEARERREEARALLAQGIDPGAQRKAEQAEMAQLRAVAEARVQFSIALDADGALSVTVRGNTLQLTRRQTDAVAFLLLDEREKERSHAEKN